MNDILVKIGTIIHDKRVGSALSITYVMKRTLLKERYILAIEDGSIDKLLSPAYVSGYIRTYLHLLELDCNELVEEYLRNVSTDTKAKRIWKDHQSIYEENILPKPIILLASIFIMVLVYGVWHFIVNKDKVKIFADMGYTKIYYQNSDNNLRP